MGERKFMQVSDAICEAAIQAGCRFFAGYPINPATELVEYMAKRMPEVGGVNMNAASEVEAAGMVFGAAATGARAMTATSSSGFSLLQEYSVFYSERLVPAVLVNMCRAGLQADYFQLTRGGGHGDYRQFVVAPSTGQEAVDLTMLAFDLADRWRMGAVVFGDTALGHTSETVEFNPRVDSTLPAKDSWTTTGAKGRKARIVGMGDFGSPEGSSAEGYEGSRSRLVATQAHRWGPEKLAAIEATETRWEEYRCDDADTLVVAFGTAARFARPGIDQLRAEGHRVGLFRPTLVWPYPTEALRSLAVGKRKVVVYELNWGQMVDDVRIAVEGRAPVELIANHGTISIGFGRIDTPDTVYRQLRDKIAREEALAR